MTQSDDMEQQIRDRAYAIWQEEGEPEGRESEHWAKARAEFDDAAAAPKKPPRKPRATTPKANAESKEAAAKPAKAKAPAKPAATRKAKAKSKA